MDYKTISFYQYTPVRHPEELCGYLRTLCADFQLLGRILIAPEGINTAVSGKINEVEDFKRALQENVMFSTMTFREQISPFNTFHKLTIKVRPEIVAFGAIVDLQKAGKHLPPQELQRWYEEHHDFVIVDARNDYESAVGRFEKALTLPIKNFRKFPAAVPSLTRLKNKKIVLYCTGGIRCEKASAYLHQQGFSQVYQLEGGIINYINQYPQGHWQGGLFVFDDRLVADAAEPLTQCQFCRKAEDQYHNCHNLDCDQLFIACEACLTAHRYTCSESCRQSPRQRRKEMVPLEIKRIGRVHNYYPQAKVALVQLEQNLTLGASVSLMGNTTPLFTQTIAELRQENGDQIEAAAPGDMVTFPVLQKVRAHDQLVLCI